MKKVGAFTLNNADPNKVTDPDAYKFTVNFQLGGSELTATAIDDQTNQCRQPSFLLQSSSASAICALQVTNRTQNPGIDTRQLQHFKIP